MILTFRALRIHVEQTKQLNIRYLCCHQFPGSLWVTVFITEAKHHLVPGQVSAVMGKFLQLCEEEEIDFYKHILYV